uniref:Uncharacterized protein n=1 Tax=Megaselia scalaris TaxID=36166 RepID=T1GTL2_MEGSC
MNQLTSGSQSQQPQLPPPASPSAQPQQQQQHQPQQQTSSVVQPQKKEQTTNTDDLSQKNQTTSTDDFVDPRMEYRKMINKKVAEDESLKNVQVPPKSPTSMITRVQKVYVPTHEEDDDEEELRFGVELNRYPPRSPVPKPRTPPPFKNTSESDTDGGKSTPDITSGH